MVVTSLPSESPLPITLQSRVRLSRKLSPALLAQDGKKTQYLLSDFLERVLCALLLLLVTYFWTRLNGCFAPFYYF